MLPKSYLFAGCGGCHTHLSVPNLAQLEKGKSRFEQADCLACHKLDGRGGTLRPGGAGGQEGPDLSRVGATGFKPDWYDNTERRKKRWRQALGFPPSAICLKLTGWRSMNSFVRESAPPACSKPKHSFIAWDAAAAIKSVVWGETTGPI
jgi:hypothetical protein